MDVLKQYFETSSLAGLSFIYSSKSIYPKASWITIFCVCIFLSSYFIHDSFNSWDKQPTTATVSIHPISEVDLPGIIVCPPRGSHTGLNYDLLTVKNISMEERQEMVDKVLPFLVAEDAESYVGYLETFVERGRPRNWLEGHSPVALPVLGTETGEDRKVFQTSATSGSFHTPQNMYEKKADWTYKILIDGRVHKKYPNTYIVLNLSIDLIKDSSEFLIDPYPLSLYNWAALEKYLEFSGNMIMQKKYKISDVEEVILRFDRFEEHLSGFHVEWHYEDLDGTIVEVKQTPLFSHGLNRVFKTFIEMMKRGKSSEGITSQQIMERLKILKHDWVLRNQDNRMKCQKLRRGQSEYFRQTLKEEDITSMLSQFSFYRTEIDGTWRENITDEMLQDGYEIFIMLLPCIQSKQVTDGLEIYKNLLDNSTSTRTIVKELFYMSKVDSEKYLTEERLRRRLKLSGGILSVFLLKQFAKMTHLSYGKLDAALSSKHDDTTLLNALKAGIEISIGDGNCTNLNQKSIGDI